MGRSNPVEAFIESFPQGSVLPGAYCVHPTIHPNSSQCIIHIRQLHPVPNMNALQCQAVHEVHEDIQRVLHYLLEHNERPPHTLYVEGEAVDIELMLHANEGSSQLVDKLDTINATCRAQDAMKEFGPHMKEFLQSAQAPKNFWQWPREQKIAYIRDARKKFESAAIQGLLPVVTAARLRMWDEVMYSPHENTQGKESALLEGLAHYRLAQDGSLELKGADSLLLNQEAGERLDGDVDSSLQYATLLGREQALFEIARWSKEMIFYTIYGGAHDFENFIYENLRRKRQENTSLITITPERYEYWTQRLGLHASGYIDYRWPRHEEECFILNEPTFECLVAGENSRMYRPTGGYSFDADA